MLRRSGRRFAGFVGISIIVLFLVFPVVTASATVYVFEQTAASVPNLEIVSSISVNGQINDLPNVNSLSNPMNLGNLIDFMLTGPVGKFTLDDFTPACELGSCLTGFPEWSISPGGISFINAEDSADFFISGFANSSTIQVDSDGLSSLPQCDLTGACRVTGNWVPIPEPPIFTIFMVALAFLALNQIARKRKSALPSLEPNV